MPTVAAEAQDQAERPGVAVVAQNGLLVVDGIQRRAVVMEPDSAILVGGDPRNRPRHLQNRFDRERSRGAGQRG
jgi:hypothetical protein